MSASTAPTTRPTNTRQRLAILERLRELAEEENLSIRLCDAIDEAIDEDRQRYAIQLGIQTGPLRLLKQARAAEKVIRCLASIHILLDLNLQDFGEDHPRGEDAQRLLKALFPQGIQGLRSLPGSLLYAIAGVFLDKALKVLEAPARALAITPQLRLLEQRHAELGAALAEYDDPAESAELDRQGEQRMRELRRRCLESYPGPDPESQALRQAIRAAFEPQDPPDPQRPDF